MRLTAAGELLMAAAGNWQKDYARVQAQIADLNGLRRGHVGIAIIDALSKGFVAEVLRAMRVEFPGITFTLKVLDNEKVAAAIAAGEVDFGILLDPQFSRALTVGAHLEVRLGFVTLAGHPLAAASSQRFSACAGYPIVAPNQPLALCQQVRALEAATGTTLDRAMASDNIQMIKTMVSAGVGVGILTALDVAVEVESGDLAFTPISDAAVRPLTLALCQMPSRQLSSAGLRVLDRLETTFAALSRT